MILQTLYQNCIKAGVRFYDEYHVVDLLFEGGDGGDGGRAAGVIGYRIADGELHTFRAKAVLLATGGNGRMFRITSNAHSLTGDGMSLAYRHGIPLQDMEFYQFHPTGLYGLGILLSEAARGEGGYLLNKDGERFMSRYAPTLMELAPRDMVSRAIYLEVKAGQGAGPKGDYVLLDVRHLGRKVIEEKLPDITDFARVYLGVEPLTEPVPTQPTAHYAMGGVPTDLQTRVIRDERNTVVEGLFAAGEVACVSVHGANRLGTNSLVDLLVFGRRAGLAMAAHCAATTMPEVARDAEAPVREEIEALRGRPDGESPVELKAELATLMMDNVGVFRTEPMMQAAVAGVAEIKERYGRIRVRDVGKVYNTDLLEARELGYLIDSAEAMATSALARRESRGAHSRDDFPERDDAGWLKHTLAYRGEAGPTLRYKPVTVTRFEPKPRTY
jgi:succinate dehydrogenase / fumarate reductase flavoprotein subunit